MRKYQLMQVLSSQDAQIAELEHSLIMARLELAKIKNTIIRVNVSTDVGVRPIYQAELPYAIILTKAHGGRGLMPGEDQVPLIEVVSEWNPPHFDDSIDQMEMDERRESAPERWRFRNIKTDQHVVTHDATTAHDLADSPEWTEEDLPEPQFYEADYPGGNGI